MNYGVVGTGWIAEAFVNASKNVPDMYAKAVYSRTEENGTAFMKKTGISVLFTNIEEMAKCDEIEAVYIASPNFFHYEQSKLFLEKGKHVICEKPITVTPAQLAELHELAEKKGLVYMEALMMLYSPARHILKKAVNEIGTIRSAHFDFSQLSSKYPAFVRGEKPNIFNPKLATGCLMDLGIYCVYPAIDLWGVPENISAVAGFLTTGADCCGSAVFQYPELLLTLTYSKVGQDRVGSQIVGDKGTITIGSISMYTDIKKYDNNGDAEILVGEETRDTIMGCEAKAFYDFIHNPDCTREMYEESYSLALKVSKAMEEIRNKAKIEFK